MKGRRNKANFAGADMTKIGNTRRARKLNEREKMRFQTTIFLIRQARIDKIAEELEQTLLSE